MKKGLSILLVLCTLMCMLLTGCGNSSVNLNDYVVITDEGYDGYGKLSVKLDYEKLIEDHEDKLTDKNIDSSIFGVKTPKLAAAFVFEAQKPYELSYEDSDTLKNGDKVEFTWETNANAIETLKGILEVNIKYDKFTHTVKDLEALTEFDPFENIDYNCGGFSGNGTINKATATYTPESGFKLEWSLDFDKSKNGTWSNGDTISLSINNEQAKETAAREHGLKLTRTTADLKLEALRYFPTENPQEIFEYFSEEDKQNVIEAVKDKYKKYAGEIKVEYVGAMYYYTDPIDFTKTSYEANNRFVLVFHVTNGIEPDGWYTYMSPSMPSVESVYIDIDKDEDGKITRKTVWGGKSMVQTKFPTTEGSYISERKHTQTKNGPATYFTYNNLYYEGCQTIKDCIETFTYYNVTNVTKLFSGQKVEMPYNHVVATDNLKQYIKEY